MKLFGRKVISSISTGTRRRQGLGPSLGCSQLWESCLIDVADLRVVGFHSNFSLNKILLSSFLGNEKVALITDAYGKSFVLFARLLGKDIDFLPVLKM